MRGGTLGMRALLTLDPHHLPSAMMVLLAQLACSMSAESPDARAYASRVQGQCQIADTEKQGFNLQPYITKRAWQRRLGATTHYNRYAQVSD